MHSHGWGWNKRQAETGSEMRKGAAQSLHLALPLRCSTAALLKDGGSQRLFFVVQGFSACNWSVGPCTAETLRIP